MRNAFGRRKFINKSGAIAAGSLVVPTLSTLASFKPHAKQRVALVGTGIRGTSFWGRRVAHNYSNEIEFVGLCDKNEGRAKLGNKLIGVECPTFTDFDKMMNTVNPDLVIVTTMDSTHHEFIIKSLMHEKFIIKNVYC